jgi:DNA-binding NtrC family response regulator
MADLQRHILLVEDESALRQAIAEQLTDHGYQVAQAESGEAALSRLADFAFDIIITDLRLPGINGSEVLESAVARYPDIVAIVVTGFGTVKDAVEAIKRGAWDFVSKPFQIDELLHALDSALEQRRLKSENAYLRAQLEERYRFEGLVGKSPVMKRLFQLLETVAPTNSTILITGETGTGKEVVARAIHHNSARRSLRFVALNCSAIPETLLEAELFGHVRGAFTGAVGNRQGRFEQAHKGTLFLDEVGTMSTALQTKLLRALQEREFERVGDSHTIKVDVRVIAATNSDLAKMVADGQFREDLFYRLNVIPIQIPSLRDRKEDIPLLVQHFLDKIQKEGSGSIASRRAAERSAAERSASLSGERAERGERTDRSARGRDGHSGERMLTVSQDAMRRLMAYHWPGNVRQLENAIERAVAFSGGRPQIDVGDLPTEIQQAQEADIPSAVTLPEDGMDLDSFIGNIERELIERSLERTGGNKGQAAKLLGLKRTTLVEKLKRISK